MKNIIKIILNFCKFIIGSVEQNISPIKIGWEVTERCNSKCKTCQRWRNNNISAELTTAEGIDFLKQIKDAGVSGISFSGGEPLLRKDIFDLVRYAKRIGLQTSIISNGFMINSEDKAALLCSSGLDRISLSIDGSTPAVNDWIRGVNGGYEKVIRATALLQKHRTSNKPKIYYNTTFNKKNIFQFHGMVKLITKMNIDGWGFQLIHNSREALLFPVEEILVERNEINELCHQIKETKAKHKHLFANYDGFYSEFATYVQDKKKLSKYRCIAGSLAGIIEANGNIRACQVAPYILGNIREKSFKEIWYSAKAKEIRQKIKDGKCPVCWLNCYAPLSILLYDLSRVRLNKIFNKNNWSSYLSILKELL